MRNLKKILALVLAMVMTFSVMATANAFTDDKDINPTYAEAIDVLAGMGVFKGNPDGSFAPTANITRAEVAAIIYRITTADVKDVRANIYSDYAKFDDVNPNAWYAGYVGYCANAEYIKGYNDTTFGPNDNVTGYQALAMILRAMGYDQNGEFTGKGWEIRVAQVATERGILVNVKESTLNSAAARQLVAEILFQAIQKSTVVYTPALGYQTANIVANPWNSLMTDSLGWKNFGLTNTTGIVVGNQATGESYTMISADYDYANGVAFNTETGLDMFGHAMKVWFNGKNTGAKTVYASYDKATKADVVVAADANLAAGGKLLAAVKTAGFSALTSAAHWSNSYGQIQAEAKATATPTASTVYSVISNNAVGTVDVVIKVAAQVAKIVKVDTTSTTNTLTLGGSTYGENGTINLASVTAGSTTTLGSIVIANKILGTAANTKLPYYDLDAVTKTVTAKVVAVDNATGKVVLSDGTTLEKSPLYNVVMGNCIAQVATWSNATYVFTLDNSGKYLGAALYNDNSFIYGTYADYASAGTNTGTVNYYLTGVTLDGQIVTKDITKYLGANPMSNYINLAVAQKAWSTNNIETGAHTGYAITSTGALTTDTTNAGVKVLGADKTITAANVTAGYMAMANNTKFMTNATKFVVVSGTGTDTLKVTTYNGISELLGAADSVTIDAANVYYTESAYIYNNVVGQTFHIDTVILGADDLSYVTTSNVYYAAAVKAGLTSTVTVGGELVTVTQYQLYKDGAAAYYYVLGNAPVADTFYILTDSGLAVDGAPVYTIASTTKGTISGTYAYVGATNNLDTAAIGGQLKTVTGATVVNLVGTSYNLGSIAELNNAVSTGYTVTVDCVTTAAGVTVIYVTGCTMATAEAPSK